jgi:hypothetical protein
VVAAAVAVRLSLIGEEPRDDNQLVTERLQPGQRRREFKTGAGAGWQPFIVDDAIG